jgi:hypothetical protein
LSEWSWCDAAGWLQHCLGLRKAILDAASAIWDDRCWRASALQFKAKAITQPPCYRIICWVLRLW